MHPTGKAVWFIESHSADAIDLDTIATVAGVSPYHLLRAFAAGTGMSVMRYVRARRLSEAARRLAMGDATILGTALDAGYGSHEAFTRAFRERFGVTPESIRQTRRIDHLALQEPITMPSHHAASLAPPRFETGRAMRIAGLSERYPIDATAGIPGLWQRFQPFIGTLPGEVRGVAYGVCGVADASGHFDYLAGVEVPDGEVPRDLAVIRLAAHPYAVFAHRDHVASIHRTMNAIWNDWLPGSGCTPAEAPCFERYDRGFDPATGQGGLEIWLPLTRIAGAPDGDHGPKMVNSV